MWKDASFSFFVHLVIFIGFAIYSLFFVGTSSLYNVRINIVSEINTTEDTQNHDQDAPILKSDSHIKNQQEEIVEKLIAKSEQPPSQTTAALNNMPTDENQKDTAISKTTIDTPNEKKVTNIPNQAQTQEKPNNANNPELLATSHQNTNFTNEKQKFLDQINNPQPQELSDIELSKLKKQVSSCWYGQRAHDARQNIVIKVILFMNQDATINHIKVVDQDSYSTPLEKAVLNQILRALNNPRCQKLNLPNTHYENWKTINMTFTSSDLY